MLRRWCLVSCAFALTCGDDPPAGVWIDGEPIQVIDMHLHPADWDQMPQQLRTFIAERLPWPLLLRPERFVRRSLSADGIVDELDRAGIDTGVIFAVYSPRTVGIASNQLIQEGVSEHAGRLLGLAAIRLDNWSADAESELEKLEEALGQPGMIGLELAHAHMHVRMDDTDYFPIYELAGRLGKPVYLHTGTTPFPGVATGAAYSNPAYIESAIAAYPQTIFILGHLCYDSITDEVGELDTCIDLARRYPNVYLESNTLSFAESTYAAERMQSVYEAVKAADVIDRVIYGSGGPQIPGYVGGYLERTVDAMHSADYDNDEIEAVLYGNFIHLFGAEAGE